MTIKPRVLLAQVKAALFPPVLGPAPRDLESPNAELGVSLGAAKAATYYGVLDPALVAEDEDKMAARIEQARAQITKLKKQQAEASPRGAAQLQESIDTLGRYVDHAIEDVDSAYGFAGGTLANITLDSVPENTRAPLLSRLPIREGERLSAASIVAAGKAVRELDESSRPSFQVMHDGKIAFVVEGGAR